MGISKNLSFSEVSFIHQVRETYRFSLKLFAIFFIRHWYITVILQDCPIESFYERKCRIFDDYRCNWRCVFFLYLFRTLTKNLNSSFLEASMICILEKCSKSGRVLLEHIFNRVKRMMGVEPTSQAWEARVIAVIRHPQHVSCSIAKK